MNELKMASQQTLNSNGLRRRLGALVCGVSAILGLASLLSAPAAGQGVVFPPRVPKKHPDYNGDGLADLAIGAPWENKSGGGHLHAYLAPGALHVVYGYGGGLAWAKNQFWSDSSRHGNFGGSVAWGDFNKDGFDDVAIGSPNNDSYRGCVDILYGTASGLTEVRHQIWTRDVLYGAGSGKVHDFFGHALAVGDYNGDGYADLAIAAPHADNSDNERDDRPGSVHILYGSRIGLTYSGAFAPLPQAFYGIPGIHSLAAGDFNKDGRAELAIGAPRATVKGHESAGVVHVFAGTSTGLQRSGVAQFWTQDSPNIPDIAEDDDQFGSALAVGDFNKDGFLDMAISAPGENASSGVVHILHGSRGGLKEPGNQLWSQDSMGVPGAAQPGEYFGAALAAGDFNGDGCADLAIGVPGELNNSGAVNVLYGSRPGSLTTVGAQRWSQDSPDVLGGAEAHDFFGASLFAADFNRSGHDELAIGVPGENDGRGAVNVLFGSRFGLTAINNQILMEQFQGLGGSARTGNRFGTLSCH